MADRINIMGVPVDMVNYEEALARFRTFVEEEGVSLIVTPNSEIVVNAGKNEELMNAIRRAEMVIPDGIGLVYASKILGHPLEERVTGIGVPLRQQTRDRGKSGGPDGGSLPGASDRGDPERLFQRRRGRGDPPGDQ